MQRTFLLLLVALLPEFVLGQVDSVYFDRTYGGNSRDWNGQIIVNSAGAIYFAGDVQSDTSGNKTVQLCNTNQGHSDIWLCELDDNGNILWQKDLGAEGDERLPQLIPVSGAQGNLLMVCQSTSNNACDKSEPNRDTIPAYSTDYWVCKLDNTGNIIWEKTIGGESFDDYVQAAELTNGDLIICGESNSPVSGEKNVPNYTPANDLWTVKLNSSGNIIGDYVYGGDGAEYLTSIIALDQDQFLLSGSTTSDVSGDVSESTRGSFDYWMIKVDAGGTKLWDKRFGGSGGERCQTTIQTNDGGFLMCGFTTSPADGDISQNPKGLQDIWVVKTDANGTKEWDKRFGGNSACIPSKVRQTQDKGYLILGYTDCLVGNDVSDPGYGATDYWLLQIDSTGNKLWDKRFGGTGDDFATSWGVLSDSLLMLFGYADSGATVIRTDTAYGLQDLWMVKVDLEGLTTGIYENEIALESQLIIAPNPNNGIFQVWLNSAETEPNKVWVSDVTGRIVYALNAAQVFDSGNLDLDLSYLDSGYYTLSILGASGNSVNARFFISR